MSTEAFDKVDRLKEIESLRGTLVERRQPADGGIVQNAPPVTLVPVPRRSRIFLRSGEGSGEFADLTVTAPDTRPDPA